MGLLDLFGTPVSRWNPNAAAAMRGIWIGIDDYSVKLAYAGCHADETLNYVRYTLPAYPVAAITEFPLRFSDNLRAYADRISRLTPQAIKNLVAGLHAGSAALQYKGSDVSLALMLVGIEQAYGRSDPFSGRWYNTSLLTQDEIGMQMWYSVADSLGFTHDDHAAYMAFRAFEERTYLMSQSLLQVANWQQLVDQAMKDARR